MVAIRECYGMSRHLARTLLLLLALAPLVLPGRLRADNASAEGPRVAVAGEWMLETDAQEPDGRRDLLAALEEAIHRDDAGRVRGLLDEGLSPDFQFEGGFSVWGLALHHGAEAVLAQLEASGWPESARTPFKLGGAPPALPSALRVPFFTASPLAEFEPPEEGIRLDVVIDREGRLRFPIVKGISDVRAAHLLWLLAGREHRYPPPLLPDGQLGIRWTVPLQLVDEMPAADRGFYKVVELEHPPRPLRRTAPRYPEAALAEGLTGDIVVEFVILPDGTVDVATVKVVSTAHAVFIEPTLEALREWRFEPGKLDGRAIPTRVRQRIPFRVN